MKPHSKKIALIFGTRPEIIKLSSVIRLLDRQKRPYFMIHTGQHYSYAMDRVFFEELELPEPRYQLSVRSRPSRGHGDHTGRLMVALERILRQERPEIVLVQGDTNSAAAGALVAAKLKGVVLGHVEAGLRSYDRLMPEEINRMIADRVSDLLFAPTPDARKILLGEGVLPKSVFVTGNTLVDAVKQNLAMARRKVKFPEGLVKEKSRFFLLTLHRPENVDCGERLGSILKGVEMAARRFKTPVLFPVHPRTRWRLRHFALKLPEGIRVMAPTGFLAFLRLEEAAAMVLTDSGGVQEEACLLRVPCVTLRTTTERPETVKVGANVVAGSTPGRILSCAEKMMAKERRWTHPFGDGRSAERIVEIIRAWR